MWHPMVCGFSPFMVARFRPSFKHSTVGSLRDAGIQYSRRHSPTGGVEHWLSTIVNTNTVCLDKVHNLGETIVPSILEPVGWVHVQLRHKSLVRRQRKKTNYSSQRGGGGPRERWYLGRGGGGRAAAGRNARGAAVEEAK